VIEVKFPFLFGVMCPIRKKIVRLPLRQRFFFDAFSFFSAAGAFFAQGSSQTEVLMDRSSFFFSFFFRVPPPPAGRPPSVACRLRVLSASLPPR